MNGHNINLYGELTETIIELSSNTHLISTSADSLGCFEDITSAEVYMYMFLSEHSLFHI